ncbi:MAG: response regulator [Candidatus Omnitrophica bacterium]|nr:response regulator [Candidatus Omnitrophota bacterium]
MDKKRILIIDDDVDLCEGMADFLMDEGYEVKNTSDPDEGMRWIQQHDFEIAIFDFKMPRVSGIDLLKSMNQKNPMTKVFIVTGKPFIEKMLKEEKVAHLVSGVISKPFNHEFFLEKINMAAV